LDGYAAFIIVLVESCFVVVGAEVSVGGVESSPVVEAFDEVEEGGAGLVVGGETRPVEEFAFEGGEERLRDRTIIANTGGPDGASHLALAAEPGEFPR